MAKPEKKYRCGGVEAAVWKNRVTIDGHDVAKYSVRIQRRYRDTDGEWKDTSSFPLSDLPRVALVAMRSFEWLALKQSDEQGNMQGNIEDTDSSATMNRGSKNTNSTQDTSDNTVPKEKVQ